MDFFIFFLIGRHIYVADIFDHSVHVLERREDNALDSVKVNITKYQLIHAPGPAGFVMKIQEYNLSSLNHK